jgi:U3 small nucleolar RNA-associated protein 5
MPDLVARLSHLHATLTSRLALQEQLLGLSGRLDLVLAQVELRSSTAPAPLKIKSNKRSAVGKPGTREPQKYVEGESSDEENEDEGGMDVEIEDADDGGSVEDVELGGFSDDESGNEDEDSEEDEDIDDSEEDDEDEDDEDADTHGNLNGFIDDEAEEDYEEDESDDYSE